MTDAIRSADLVATLVADPERAMGGMEERRAADPKATRGLLKPFGIVSETVHLPGRQDAKGYKRCCFEEAWAAYLPGQNPSSSPFTLSMRPSVQMPMKWALLAIFEASRNSGSGRIEKCRLILQPCGFGRLDGSEAAIRSARPI